MDFLYIYITRKIYIISSPFQVVRSTSDDAVVNYWVSNVGGAYQSLMWTYWLYMCDRYTPFHIYRMVPALLLLFVSVAVSE